MGGRMGKKTMTLQHYAKEYDEDLGLVSMLSGSYSVNWVMKNYDRGLDLWQHNSHDGPKDGAHYVLGGVEGYEPID